MTNLRIERDGSDLVVHVDVPVREAQRFQDVMKACRRTGVWSCPSGECVRIDRFDVQQDGDTVVLRLTPPSGATLSVAGVDECVRYMIGTPVRGTTR